MNNLNDRFMFDKEKAIEAVLYFSQHAPDTGPFYLSKICYFADLLHLERYGRTIFGDSYIKYDNGPVLENTYLGLYKRVENTSLFRTGLVFIATSIDLPFTVKDSKIHALRDFDPDELSISDIECLQESIDTHGHKTYPRLREDSHDAAWTAADKNSKIDMINMIQMLPNAEDLLDHLNT